MTGVDVPTDPTVRHRPVIVPRAVALGVVAVILLAVYDAVPTVPPPVPLAVAALVGWRLVPRFWPTVGTGALGGAIAGLLVLGPGARVAMRLVALADPLRTPEFTLEGTIFIVLAFGGALGAVTGVAGALLRFALGLSYAATAAALTACMLVGLVSDPVTRAELTGLGWGAWVNLPMFTAVFAVYGAATVAIWRRLARRRLARRRRRSHATLAVPAADVRA